MFWPSQLAYREACVLRIALDADLPSSDSHARALRLHANVSAMQHLNVPCFMPPYHVTDGHIQNIKMSILTRMC